MDSRWRWPPETLVPPWAMRRLKPDDLFFHEALGLRRLQRIPQFFVRGVGLAEAQVVLDGPGEQVRLLRHRRYPAGDLRGVHLGDGHAVEQDVTGGDVVKPRQQRDQGGLAGTGGADDGQGLARLGGEGDVTQHRRLGTGVLEGDIAELHASLLLGGHHRRRRGCGWKARRREPRRCGLHRRTRGESSWP